MCHSIGLNLTCTNVSTATNVDRSAALYEYTLTGSRIGRMKSEEVAPQKSVPITSNYVKNAT